MPYDACEPARAPLQLDLFVAQHSSLLESELWRRRQDRKDAGAATAAAEADVGLVSLALALARLAAQRDARRLVVGEGVR